MVPHPSRNTRGVIPNSSITSTTDEFQEDRNGGGDQHGGEEDIFILTDPRGNRVSSTLANFDPTKNLVVMQPTGMVLL